MSRMPMQQGVLFGCVLSSTLLISLEAFAEPAKVPTDLYGDALPDGAVARLGTVRFRHGDHISSAVFSSDEKVLITCGGSWVRFWDTETGRQIATINAHVSRLSAMAISVDGKSLAACTVSEQVSEIIIWDTETRKQWKRWVIPKVYCWSIAFSHDNKTLVFGGDDNIVHLQQVTDWSFNKYQWPYISAVTPEGTTMAVKRGHSTFIIELWKGTPLKKHSEIWWMLRLNPACLTLSNDGKILALVGEVVRSSLCVPMLKSSKLSKTVQMFRFAFPTTQRSCD